MFLVPLLQSCLLLAVLADTPMGEWRGVVRGTVELDQVFTCGTVHRLHPSSAIPWGGGTLSVQSAQIDRDAPVSDRRVPVMIGWFESPYAPLRWQLQAGQFHVVSFWPIRPNAGPRYGKLQAFSRADLERCPVYPTDPRPKDQVEAGTRLFRARARHEVPLVPYDDHFYDTKVIEDARRPRVYFDFLPTEDGGYEAYVLAQGKVTRSRVTPHQNGQESVWIEQRSWEADWAGPFYVAGRGGDRYLVTDAGRVFAIPKATQSEFRLKEIWKGKPPVDALIHDADAKKWYAFTKDEYFEVEDSIKPKAHILSVRLSKTAGEALETAVRCGRVVRGITEPKDKKDK